MSEMLPSSYNQGYMVELSIDAITRHFTAREHTDWMLPLFWSVSRKYPNVRIGEIGMRGATSTLPFLMAALDTLGHVYSMDITTCENGRELIQQTGLSGLHTFLHGDSKAMDFPEMLDVLFIDGDHSYDGVKADYERHAPRVKSGGIIFLHDPISCAGVMKLCKEKGIFVLPLGAGLGIQPC